MQALSRFVSCTCLPLHEDSLVSSGSSGTWFLVFAIDHNNTILLHIIAGRVIRGKVATLTCKVTCTS